MNKAALKTVWQYNYRRNAHALKMTEQTRAF